MKRFFVKIGRFFWSWGFLKFVLGCIAFVILVYVEEDWRGAREWAATKAKWEARGETFDYSKFIPPPVPDEQNLAAIPLFKLVPVKNADGTTYVEADALNRAARNDLPGFDSPRTPNWEKGETPDMAEIKKTLASDYALAFKNGAAPNDALEQFDGIYPFLADFIAAAATHSVFRLNDDYSISPPAARPFGALVATIKLAKILTLHGVLALDQKRSDLALQDLKINYELVSGAKRDPTLVGGLVAIGVAAIGNGILYDGLAQHEWSDAELVEIDQTLKPINFLSDFQFAMRCEVTQLTANFEFFERANLPQMQKTFGRGAVAESGLEDIFRFRWPSGWWDGNKTRFATLIFGSLAGVDPQARLFFPKAADNLQNQIERARAKWSAFAPWNILAYVAAGPITNSAHQYAQAQVWIDEARIACALERYRLAKGVYPGSLDALAPAYIDAVPHDIMNGEAYHYRLNADGTFLLYSVGWNQVDDGGKVVLEDNFSKRINYEKGDWVWPTPKYSSGRDGSPMPSH